MPRPADDRPLRLFVAIHPPAAAAARMLEILAQLTLPANKPVPPEQIHVTAHFIGDVHRKRVEETIESVERSASGVHAFTLTPSRLIALPERGHSRLIALETDAPPPLLELHRRLVHRLARPARPSHASERFVPHFTLCRFAHDARAERIDRPVSLDPIPIVYVSLMRSILRPEGARHEEVRRWELDR